jgi:hypothetical protein
MSFFEELVYEQDGPSMAHLHVAAQTRGSALLLHSLLARVGTSNMSKMGLPCPTCMSLRRRVGLLRSWTRYSLVLAHPCAKCQKGILR